MKKWSFDALLAEIFGHFDARAGGKIIPEREVSSIYIQ